MDEQDKINKETVTKFKTIDKVLENINSKVTEVGSSNHQVLNMMKMLETQVGQLAGRLTNDEGKLPGQPKGPESAKAIQTRSGKETEDPERSAGARKPKPSAEAEGIAKEKVTEIATEEPEFEMSGEDTRIPQLKPRYFRGKLDNHFEKIVEVDNHGASLNRALNEALQIHGGPAWRIFQVSEFSPGFMVFPFVSSAFDLLLTLVFPRLVGWWQDLERRSR
jgi:hypothetical protein